jgi:hypothetical protein
MGLRLENKVTNEVLDLEINFDFKFRKLLHCRFFSLGHESNKFKTHTFRHFSRNFTRFRNEIRKRINRFKNRKRANNNTFKNTAVSESLHSSRFTNGQHVARRAAMVTVVVAASISSSPALGFNVARQQAMTNFIEKSLRGDCRGLLPATSTTAFESSMANPLGLADSPTRMIVGRDDQLMSYYVGGVVGNCILVASLVALSQLIGTLAFALVRNPSRRMKKRIKKSGFLRSLKERCLGSKHSKTHAIRRIFASSYVSLTFFFCVSLLMTPTISSTLVVLVAAMNDPKLKEHESSPAIKFLCVALSLVLCFVAVHYISWAVLFRSRKSEKYKSFRELGVEEPGQGSRGILAKFFKARGEWSYPSLILKNNSNDEAEQSRRERKAFKKKEQIHEDRHLNFLIAEPAFESYRETTWFALVEIANAIAISFPPFAAQFSSSAKGSCLIQGIILVGILLVYTALLIWRNPFKLRILRIMNPILAVQQLLVSGIGLALVLMRKNGNEDEESPGWLWKILIVPLAFQGVMSFVMIIAAIFAVLVFLKKFQARLSKGRNLNELFAEELNGRRRAQNNGDEDENAQELL